MKKLFTRVVRTALLAMCALMALPAAADNWELYVAPDGSTTYTKYSVTQDGDNYTSEEFTIKQTDHFYLKNTTSNKEHVRHIDNGTHLWTINGNDSSNKYGYMPSGTHGKDNDIYWDSTSKTIKIHFSYTNDNPYNIYWEEVSQGGGSAPSSFKIYGKLDSSDWDGNGKQMTLNGNVYSLNDLKITNEFKFNDGSSDYGPTQDNDTYKKIDVANLSSNPYTADVKKGTGATWYVSEAGTYNVSVDFSNPDAPKLTLTATSTQEKVATPVISQNGNKVFITCETEGATIYCSFNGNDPEINDNYKYDPTNGASFTANCTVKAIAVKEGMANSAVAEKAVTYTNCFTPGTYYIDLEGADFWAGDGPSLNVKIGDQTISPVRINVNYYSFTITDANISSVYITRTKGGDTWGSATVYPPTNNEDVIWIKTNGSSGGHLDNEWTTQMELPENVYLHYTDWKDNDQAKSIKLNKEGNCYFTTTQAVSSKGLVKLSNGLTGDDLVYYGYASSGYTPSSLNDPIKLQKDGYEFDATEGYLNFFVDFSDRRNPKVTVTPQSPHRLSINGAVKMNGATSADGFEMDWNNGTLFTLNNVTINGDFNFVNPGTGIVYGARGGDVTLEMQSPADKVYAQGYPRRRSTSVWKLKDFDKDQVYDIKVSFMNPRNPSLRIEKHVDPMETPEKLYIIGNHIGDNPWQPEHAMEMTKNGDTFTYTVRKYKANEEGYFRFLTSQSFDTQQYGSTEMNVEFKVDAYMPLQAGTNNWKFNHNSDGNYIVTVNFKTGKVHVAFSEGNAKDNLYLVGDVNKWLNDGKYDYTDDNNETKSVSYGYDPAVHGVRDQWQLKEYAPAEGQNPPAFMNDGSTWYYLDIPECSAIPKTLFGQFTIYQGTWNQHTKDNVTYYTPSWNAGEGFNQYANSFHKDNDSYLTTEAAIKYNEVFTNVTYVHNGKTDVDDDNVYVSNSNLKLADNYYQNATLFLCPDKKAIYVMVNSDDDVKNITIYYANEKAKESDKPVITANGSSINTTNYRLDTNIFNGEMEYHEGPALINGISYDRYWTKQVRPGMENPAGQKITVTISNVSTVSSDNWATIRGNDVYFLDGIHLFVEPKSEIKVEKIEFRIYGYSLDGSSIVVSDYKGDNVYSVDAPGFDSYEDAWTELYSGTFDSGKFNDAKHSLEEGVWTASTDGTHFSTKSMDDAHMIVPSQGTKFVQYRIQYTEVSSPSQKGIRKANGVRTELVPDTFRTDTPEGASWVLNGKHKLYTPGIETGVEDIFGDEFTEDGEEVETIYYNLQGQRVDNPDKGLYIRVCGTKTDKVLF